MAAPPHSDAVGLREVGRFLLRSSPSIFGFAILLASAAAIYVTVIPPVFTASAKVLVDPANSQIFTQDAMRFDSVAANARIDSQVEVVRSARISRVVITDLRLIEDPEFRSDRPARGGTLLDALGLGHSSIAAIPDGTPTPGSPTGSATQGSMWVARELLYTQAAFATHLFVRRVGQSYVLEISFRSSDPEKAAQIANAVAEAYVNDDIRVKSEAAQRGSDWLEERLGELRENTLEAMRQVERFKSVGGAGSAAESHVRFAELESNSQAYQRVFESYLQRFTETVQRVSFPVGDARIVSSATTPLAHSYPKKKLIIAFAAVLGAAGGATVPLALRSFDRRVRTRRQITEKVGAACLGTVRQADRASGGMRLGWMASAKRSTSGRLPLVLDAGTGDLLADMRAVKTAVNHATLGLQARCIGVVSAAVGEGATTLATHLALLCALSGERTLLVDACPGDPRISRELASDAEAGLMQALDHPEIITKFVKQLAPCLSVLAVGTASRASVTPGDRIASRGAALRMDHFRKAFDTTMVDLPAASVSSDALAIAPFLDGIMLVAAHGATTLDEIADLAASLRAARANVLGVVVNRIHPKARLEWVN